MISPLIELFYTGQPNVNMVKIGLLCPILTAFTFLQLIVETPLTVSPTVCSGIALTTRPFASMRAIEISITLIATNDTSIFDITLMNDIAAGSADRRTGKH